MDESGKPGKVSDPPATAPPPWRRQGPWAGLALAAVALAAAGAIYGIGPRSRNDESACPGAAALSERLLPLATGEVAALAVQKSPAPLMPLAFKRPDGTSTSLTDFKGRTVLLNLWATWCVPCRTEMPALDRLQTQLGGPDFEVVAVNIDQRNTQRAADFLDEIKVGSLVRYADPSAKAFADLKVAGLAFGMPTTLFLDKQGCVLASLAGPAEWAGADAAAFVKAALGR